MRNQEWYSDGKGVEEMGGDRPLLLLFDGNALVHRAYHALQQPLTSRSGEVVSAVYGFALMLLKVLNELKELAQQVDPESFPKLQALLRMLRGLGLHQRGCPERVVIFSERINTLRFLQDTLNRELGLLGDQIEVFHGTLDDGLPGVDERLRLLPNQHSLSDLRRVAEVRQLVGEDLRAGRLDLGLEGFDHLAVDRLRFGLEAIPFC